LGIALDAVGNASSSPYFKWNRSLRFKRNLRNLTVQRAPETLGRPAIVAASFVRNRPVAQAQEDIAVKKGSDPLFTSF